MSRQINHRDLVLSDPKRPKFHFLRLPFDLQDDIISLLDKNLLTFHGASEMALTLTETDPSDLHRTDPPI